MSLTLSYKHSSKTFLRIMISLIRIDQKLPDHFSNITILVMSQFALFLWRAEVGGVSSVCLEFLP